MINILAATVVPWCLRGLSSTLGPSELLNLWPLFEKDKVSCSQYVRHWLHHGMKGMEMIPIRTHWHLMCSTLMIEGDFIIYWFTTFGGKLSHFPGAGIWFRILISCNLVDICDCTVGKCLTCKLNDIPLAFPLIVLFA